MALHLTLDKGDKVLIGTNIVIDVRRVGRTPQLSIEAPADIKIMPVYKDSKKQVQLRGNHED